MAHDDDRENPLSPYTLAQNPAPNPLTGQAAKDKVRQQVESILSQFLQVLPSNYVSQISGPFYTLQFQAAAEQLAVFLLTAEEVYKDADWSFTRSDFLWEMLGTLVFPAVAEGRSNAPIIEGDVTYRNFLHKMVLLLLQGATPSAVETGVDCLTEAQVDLIERFLAARDPNSAWTIDNQFEFELIVDNNNQFPDQPFQLQDNTVIVVDALKAAHALYGYQNLFTDMFDQIADDQDGMSWEMFSYYYDDFRRYCLGVKSVVGTGDTLTGRTLFTDPDVSFQSVQVGATLTITSGTNIGTYRVTEILAFPFGDDATAQSYTTSPTGLSGSATVSGDVITDTAQDWAAVAEGEQLTFTTGNNAGTYRLEVLLGPSGGVIGTPLAVGPATQVRVSPTLLRLATRMDVEDTGQTYSVSVDRLGIREPKVRTGEDASSQFYL